MNQQQKIYRAKHPGGGNRPKEGLKPNYWSLLKLQTLICGTILMGILVMQRQPESGTAAYIRQTVMSEMGFSRHNHWFERYLVNLFPFSYIPPAVVPETALPVGGETEGVAASQNLTSALVRDIAFGFEINYASGIIVNAFQDGHVLSPIAGVVIDKGTDRSHEIGNYVVIQLADLSTLTIGFLENVQVTRMDHVQVGQLMGSGTVIQDYGEDAYFYLAVQNRNGEFLDTLEFLNQLAQDERAH